MLKKQFQTLRLLPAMLLFSINAAHSQEALCVLSSATKGAEKNKG